MRKLGSLAVILSVAFAPAAMAAEGSIGLTAGSGTNAGLTAADGAGFVSFLHALCGGASATMGTACANQAEVNSSGQLGVTVGNTSLAVTVASGGIASGGIASGALAAGSISSGAAVSGAFVAGAIADLAHGQAAMAASVPVVIANNQSTLPSNTAQVNGVTTLTGTGAVGTGAQRIAVGTDTATIAGSAPSVVLQTNNAQWGGTAITNVPTAVGTAGTGNTPTVNAYIVGGGASGGTSAADNSAWTAGTTNMTIEGCEYTSGGATAVTTAHAGAVGCTTGRAAFSDKTSVNGTALATATEAYGTAFSSQTATVERLDAFVTNTNGNGSATSANSAPVVIASDQAAVAVKAASGALASGSIASGALASGSISSGAAVSGAFVAGSIADLAHGQGTMAASVPVAIASDQSAVATKAASGAFASGSIASGALASGSIASGAAVSGAFVAGSIADLAHGQGAMAASVPVAIASNQSAIPVAPIATLTSGVLVKGTTAAMTGTTSTQVVALVSSQHLYITAIHCTNSSTTVPTLISIQDGSGGATLDTLAANDNFGGEDRTSGTPLFWTTAGNGLYAADVTTGASVICSASGYSSAN